MEDLSVAKYAENQDLSFSELVGDPVAMDEADHFRAFCSLDQTDAKCYDSIHGKAVPITHLCIHGHKHLHFDMGISTFFGRQGHRFSHDSKGAVASLAFSTAAAPSPTFPRATKTTHAAEDLSFLAKSSLSKKDEDEACKCGLTYHVGARGPSFKLACEDRFRSRVANCAHDGVGKVVVKYEVGTERIAVIQVFSRVEPGNNGVKKGDESEAGTKLLEWDMYSLMSENSLLSSEPHPRLESVELLNPNVTATADDNNERNQAGGNSNRAPARPNDTISAAPKPSSSWNPMVEEEMQRKWELVGFWGVTGEVCIRRLGVVWGRE